MFYDFNESNVSLQYNLWYYLMVILNYTCVIDDEILWKVSLVNYYTLNW